MAVNYGTCLLTEKRIQAFETMCLRRLIYISYLDHKTSLWMQSKVNFRVGPQKSHLESFKRGKLTWFRHVTHHGSLLKNHPSGHLGGWAMPWLAEKMLMDNI